MPAFGWNAVPVRGIAPFLRRAAHGAVMGRRPRHLVLLLARAGRTVVDRLCVVWSRVRIEISRAGGHDQVVVRRHLGFGKRVRISIAAVRVSAAEACAAVIVRTPGISLERSVFCLAALVSGRVAAAASYDESPPQVWRLDVSGPVLARVCRAIAVSPARQV